jgi:hypothetical protein
MEPVRNPRKPHGHLSDPVRAARAWARFRWIMRWVVGAAVVAVAGALIYLKADGTPLNGTVVIATSFGIALTVLLGGGLMGLIFLSAGSGHDEDVMNFDEDDDGSYWDKRH